MTNPSASGSSPQQSTGSSRRSFLKTAAVSTAALSATGSLSALHAAGSVHGGAGEPLKIGLIGCGGRGTGAARQALAASKENILWAMGDAFENRLQGSYEGLEEALEGSGNPNQIQVAPERRFVGLDCADQVLATGVDVVLLASPPGFRPMQIEKAVNKGVHVFAEKPVATDAPGLHRVRKACDKAQQMGTTVVSGLCYRYHDGRRAVVDQLHQGAVGEILAIQGNYITGELWLHQRRPDWSELENQLRNWLYYTWLSGDLIAEQHIHTLDMMAWIKQDVYPESCYSLGGRQKRTDPKYGQIFDHFATVYEWADGTRGFSYCRQQSGCFRNVNEYVMGTDGKAEIFKHQITGKNNWKADMKMRDMYQAEHDEMFAAIRAGKPINNGEYMCNSTAMAMMGRMAAYTGKKITWDQAWASREVLVPEQLSWDMEMPEVEVAVPGITKFI
ncbi:MAG: Gfo/Idh/MocA family oxidoreductase [Planctomycetota bacterium]|nr:Gfo/Idh/MocA family oxidoreductase [Planctomycetota bacterium]